VEAAGDQGRLEPREFLSLEFFWSFRSFVPLFLSDAPAVPCFFSFFPSSSVSKKLTHDAASIPPHKKNKTRKIRNPQKQAVHPYSTPIAPSRVPSAAASSSPSSTTPRLPAVLHFSDLRRLSELQAERAAEAPSKIGGVRVGADKGRRSPQAVVAATEQGWDGAGARAPSAAAAVCEAHSAVAPASEAAAAAAAPDRGAVGVAFATHNDFQGVSQGDPTGLVPAAAGAALRSLEPGASPTLAAYEATRVGVWNVESGHYCCAVVGVGCGGGNGGGSAR
jgi:hypothetical protein